MTITTNDGHKISLPRRHGGGYYLSVTLTGLRTQTGWYHDLPVTRAELAELARMIDALPPDEEPAATEVTP